MRITHLCTLASKIRLKLVTGLLKPKIRGKAFMNAHVNKMKARM